METCYYCGYKGNIISNREFKSQEAKHGTKPLGVMWTTDAFAEEIRNNITEHWECTTCWWQGWWDI